MPIQLSLQDVRALLTREVIAVWQQKTNPTNFLRGKFPVTTSNTRYISLDVQRMGEPVAVDILRGTEGNRNTFSRSTQKTFDPPMWGEYFDITQLDAYNTWIGSESINNVQNFSNLVDQIALNMQRQKDKIERAKELQCAQVLFTGTVTTAIGDNVDFRRKAASMIDLGSGNYWNNSISPYDQIEAGCNFIRQNARNDDPVFDMILGAKAASALLLNAVFLSRQNLFNMKLDEVIGSSKLANSGAVPFGRLTCGAYQVQLWTYPQFYDDPVTQISTPYIPNNYVTIIPPTPKFVFAHALVPQLAQPGVMPAPAEWVIKERMDEWNAMHDYGIFSAGLAIPVSVDEMYTMKVLPG